MKLFFICLIILLIILIPFPLKISMYFSDEDYYIKLYKIIILSKKKTTHDVKLEKKETVNKKDKKKPSKESHIKLFKKINKRFLINKLYNSKFKPFVNLTGNLYYSLGDAANTAISYGILCQACPIIYFIFNILFKTNKFKFNINPVFKDKILVKFEISSILFFSIANIINILIIIFKCMIYSKEVDP
ncbi:DUF2953 domain-containing protein [Clostridium weizhouense]|uniref:DUF2953 domain-containing protein n=1 Tax=Clostridium weizhouense TaxID=2859781 RepID=A0ABS7ANX2_9CLOT|nr:DUF2953 domain-containing protein [Clostridium weizhouense]MBW6409381.1 DUF2953 domain-containing protein [Clostridium weizhouense]